jgi:hypothetical protein
MRVKETRCDTVAELPCQAWFESSLGNSNNNKVCAEGFEGLTPLQKRTETVWSEEPVVKTELSAGIPAPPVTSSRLETVTLKANIWPPEAIVFMWVDTL